MRLEVWKAILLCSAIFGLTAEILVRVNGELNLGWLLLFGTLGIIIVWKVLELIQVHLRK